MSDSKSQPPLVVAVDAFQVELDRFAQATAAACRRELDSARALERAAESVKEALEAEPAIQARAQDLVAALRSAQERQQAQAAALAARAAEIDQRRAEYEALAERYRRIGADATALGESARTLSAGGEEGGPVRSELVAALTEMERRIAELREAARLLAADARAQAFEEIAREAQAVEQTLSAMRNKLLIAQRSLGAAPPADA